MTRIGVTGHIHFTSHTADLIRRELIGRLQPYAGDLVGVSCLALGADTIFARAVLSAGGRLEVVLPARRYREQAVPVAARQGFDELLASAEAVRVMPYDEPCPAAFRAANDMVLADIELLLAVWDGGPGEPGSAADAVVSARRSGIPVDIVWPAGARRNVE